MDAINCFKWNNKSTADSNNDHIGDLTILLVMLVMIMIIME